MEGLTGNAYLSTYIYFYPDAFSFSIYDLTSNLFSSLTIQKINKKKNTFIMAPIRVGFIGLSKSGWAPLAHFPYLNASKDYQIVAICNSTVESAKEAVLYNLPAETRTYGDPEGMSSAFYLCNFILFFTARQSADLFLTYY